MSVALLDVIRIAVELPKLGVSCLEESGLEAEPHSAAHLAGVVLQHLNNHLMFSGIIYLLTRGASHSQHVPAHRGN